MSFCPLSSTSVSQAAYGIVLLALGAGSGNTPIDKFNPLYCSCDHVFVSFLCSNIDMQPRFLVDDELLNLTALPALLYAVFDDVIEGAVGGTIVKSEPLLKQ